MVKNQNRWVIAVAGVVMQLLLGSVYAWSVFKKPIMEAHGWTGPQVGLVFTLAIAFLGISAAFAGGWVDKAGARKIATIGALMFGIGTLLGGLADQIGNLWLFYIGYGVIGGIGNGLGYVTPVAVLVRWFPDKRGLITGIAVMGFGFGAAIMGKIAPMIIPAIGVANTLYVSGSVILVCLLIAAQFLNNPPKDYSVAVPVASKRNTTADNSVDLGDALKTYQFYVLWIIFCINITAGIALISNLSPMAQQQIGMSPTAAGTVVFFTALFNGFGRIMWSWLSDKIGRKTTFIFLFSTQIPAFVLLPQVSSAALFTLLACYIFLCYGGGFSTMPAFTADTFGPKNLGRIYGKVLLAWSAAAVLGPMFMEYIKTVSDSFAMALYVAAGILSVALIMILLYRPIQKTQGNA